MEGIWVVIFVIAAFFQLFNKFYEKKGNESRQWRPREVRPIFDVIHEMDEAATSEYTYTKKQRDNIVRVPKNQKGSIERVAEDQRGSLVQATVCIAKQEQNVTDNAQSFVAATNIINGIIMAEILQPPKCKRRSQRVN